jgi:ATP-dependent DNA helicase RecQ
MTPPTETTRPDIERALRERFGFADFLEGQREVIEHLVAGRSAAAVFPTGGGKSLCYQLPAALIEGVTLVVSPLIALMKDQIDALTRRSIEARRLDSTLSADEYREVMRSVREGRVRLLYVAPERFNNERFRHSIERIQIGLFAVDEAHCISEWGHNFRPDYLKLARFARECGAKRILALTATATPRVLADVCEAFGIDKDHAVRTGFHRPNLTLLTTPADAASRDQTLLDRLAERPRGPTIVYVTQQKTAQRVAGLLTDRGLDAQAYHAGMGDEDRARVQDAFMGSDAGIVVATIAFGMGVDKADIRHVVHYNLPKSLEGYAQEIGRAGRDGLAATCELLVCPDDLILLENFVYGDTPDREAIETFVETIAADQTFEVSEYDLAQACDIRNLVVRTLLTVLELQGRIEGGTPFYANYRIRPIEDFETIVERFEGERRAFLIAVFEQAQKAKTWFDLSLGSAAEQLGQPRERIVAALDYLGEQGLVELRSTGVRRRYRWTRGPGDLRALADELHERMLARERAELRRLQEVLDYAAHDGCQTGLLCAHFDDPLGGPCGHCSWCLGDGTPMQAVTRVRPEIDPGVWSQAVELRNLHPQALGAPRAFTRFLCGVSSPRLVKARLVRDPLYGALAHVPFADVLEATEAAHA